MSVDLEPWEFHPGIDTQESFQVFTLYLQLRPRRLAEVATLYPERSLVTIRNWAKSGLWDERAISYDQHLYKIQVEARVKETKENAAEMAERHTEMTRRALAIAEREFAKLHKESIEAPFPILKPRDLLRFMTEAMKFERLIAGQPTEIFDDQRLDTTKLTQDQLDILDELMRIMKGEEPGASQIH